ncbi:ESCRT II complex subunit Dot2 [Ceratocystis pirilliformis]|uniref:Vacuolar-sorting protein SNF8 n=3 Tax=Ceratocystis TaxID=5157 RepID=A0A2C5X2D4_9PEZI|nr:Vacuolar-sorting protein SNF8 [Ceratocystis fimbriata CBS 114723]
MSHKGVGIGAFDRNRLTSAQFASHGSTLRTANAQALETQISVFRSLLQQFAQSHAKEIRSNPTFRAEFARMCAAIGVDPLAGSSSAAGSSGTGSGGSIWAQLLGRSVNDFYFELAVKVVEVCGATRGENGGLIGLKEVRDRIMSTRMEGAAEVTDDDVLRAVGTLKPLGSSYSVVKVGHKQYIRSVPRELSTDQSFVMEASQIEGYVSVNMLMANLGWAKARAQTAIEDLLSEGILWVDKQCEPWEYWNPSWIAHVEEVVG